MAWVGARSDELRRIRRLAPAMRRSSSAAMNALRCLSEKLLSDSLTTFHRLAQERACWNGSNSPARQAPVYADAGRHHNQNAWVGPGPDCLSASVGRR